MKKNNSVNEVDPEKQELWDNTFKDYDYSEIIQKVRENPDTNIIGALVHVSENSKPLLPKLLDNLGIPLCHTSSKVYMYLMHNRLASTIPIPEKAQVKMARIVEDLMCVTCKYRLGRAIGNKCDNYIRR